MEVHTVFASRCHCNCEKCGLPTEFLFFESGPGGSFRTIRGKLTGTLYRISCDSPQWIQSLDIIRNIEGESGSEQIPDDLSCRFCNGRLLTNSIAVNEQIAVGAALL